ncbi:formate dehydrogenase [Xanthomonas sp. Mitacek01]|nr:formate dehydrogenase [Xanthomonas sp. Mitacek01]
MTQSGNPDQYEGAAGGWGSMQGIASVAGHAGIGIDALATLRTQNKPRGTMCSSCAYGKPAKPHPAEFCENGAKATLWDLTDARCTPAFFADHPVRALRAMSDYDLEMEGRLTEPLRYDAQSDTYQPVSWTEAFADIGTRLRAMDPESTVFYASGKAALEPSYLYALFARIYGHNNLPDSSNMCHETTSVGLKEAIGSPVGTCVMEDFEHCDAIFCFGQNAGTNSPRFLHQLQQAAQRGCRIVVFNPIREQGLVRFTNPQSPVQMLTGQSTELACQYHQLRPGGDIAAMLGMCKHILAQPQALDRDFIDRHTQGFDTFAAKAESTDWAEIESHSGLTRAAIIDAAEVYLQSERVIGVYGMGLTQHVHGSQSVQMLVNLLLLRGNIGREGAGISPMRGHSNVQGQRTVGIAEKPELVPLDRLAELFDFAPPRKEGLNTVAACEAILERRIKAFIGLGGNLLRAIPDHDRMKAAWPDIELTVSVATRLNRTHLYPGRTAYLLPCLVRAEEDMQATGPQSVSMEDTFSHIHGSIGRRKPASEALLSEVAIVAGLAKATLAPNAKQPWAAWTADYAKVRDLIAQTYPDQFADFNARMFNAGGFYRGNPAREREWETEGGKARFMTPDTLTSLGIGDAPGRFHLTTIRSNDQFNTTIYGFSDRLRGLSGSRRIVMINRADMARLDLAEGDAVSLVCDVDDGIDRRVEGLTVQPFNLPDGCVAGYYPELNPLMPLWYHDKASATPAAKGIPIRIEPAAAAA